MIGNWGISCAVIEVFRYKCTWCFLESRGLIVCPSFLQYIEDVKGNRFRQHHGVIDKRLVTCNTNSDYFLPHRCLHSIRTDLRPMHEKLLSISCPSGAVRLIIDWFYHLSFQPLCVISSVELISVICGYL